MPVFFSIQFPASLNGQTVTFEISSFQWGVGRVYEAGTNAGGGIEQSKVSFSEITITKPQDGYSSPRLLAGAAEGLLIPAVQIIFKTAATSTTEYLKITLTDCFVSSHSFASGGDVPQESLTFVFEKVEYQTFNTDTGGQLYALGLTTNGAFIYKPPPG